MSPTDPIYHIDLLELSGLILTVAICMLIATVYAIAKIADRIGKARRGRWRKAKATMPSGAEVSIRVRRVSGGWRGHARQWVSDDEPTLLRAQRVALDGKVIKSHGVWH